MPPTLSHTDLWHPVLTLILTALAAMGSPGPATLSVTAAGAAFGLRRSCAYAFDLILGTSAVLIVVAIGIVSIAKSRPWLAPLFVIASTVYILHLAFRIAITAPLSTQSDAIDPPPSFIGGFLLGITNPKAYITIAAVFAGTTLAVAPPLAAALIKIGVLSVMIVVIHLSWLMAGASLSRLLRDPVSSRAINLMLASTLVISSLIGLMRW